MYHLIIGTRLFDNAWCILDCSQVTINNGSPVVLSFVIEDVVKKLEWVDPNNKVISQVESAKVLFCLPNCFPICSTDIFKGMT